MAGGIEDLENVEAMMNVKSNSLLVQSFMGDHVKFMELLKAVFDKVASNDLQAARTFATELNEFAGAHIAFEEAVLYPAIAELNQEDSFVAGLYEEHQMVVSAIASLLQNDDLSSEQLTEIQAHLATGLQHVDHCGTLISRLAAMDDCDQSEALDELQQLRTLKIKWTDMKRES